jgi:hypothetical protein
VHPTIAPVRRLAAKSPRAALLFSGFAALAACTRAGDPPRSSDMSQEPAAAAPADPALAGFPLSRLDFAHNPVIPLDFPLDQTALDAAGVTSYRAFQATSPPVWLLVFEFTDQARLFAAFEKPAFLVAGDPPYYTATAFTGRWLLVTGFPGEKPVSPEMEAARSTFLARWAGEE